jgi:hypothetical protein
MIASCHGSLSDRAGFGPPDPYPCLR